MKIPLHEIHQKLVGKLKRTLKNGIKNEQFPFSNLFCLHFLGGNDLFGGPQAIFPFFQVPRSYLGVPGGRGPTFIVKPNRYHRDQD